MRRDFRSRLPRFGICIAMAACALSAVVPMPGQGSKPKPRVVITADPELDDNNTIIRAILYNSDVRIRSGAAGAAE